MLSEDTTWGWGWGGGEGHKAEVERTWAKLIIFPF